MTRKIKLFFLLFVLTISLYLLTQFYLSSNDVSLSYKQHISHQQHLFSLSTTARQVTVRLVGKYISGSGVIINRQQDGNQNIYYILTCAHVLDKNQKNHNFQVITFDNKKNLVQRQIQLTSFDLAIVKFISNSVYDVATIKEENFSDNKDNNKIVYAAGFPNLKYDQGNWRNTFEQGIKHYQFNDGEIKIALSTAMEGGYKLGLTNEIEQGMSGGPLFNHRFELIGIVGRSKYGVGGINAYKFVDGSYPSTEMLSTMEELSWAIPLPLQQIRNELAITK